MTEETKSETAQILTNYLTIYEKKKLMAMILAAFSEGRIG